MTRFGCEAVVIGAGVIGLAVARALALAGHEVLVIEAADAIGTGTSSRNSEVIHSGIYYPKGSLKALACVEGRERLYAFCAERGIPHARCGKLIVAASDDELPRLAQLNQSAIANGVTDLARLSAKEVAELEPELRCAGALLSPSTGIIDSHAFMLTLQGDLEAAGGMIAFNTPVLDGDVRDGIRLTTGGSDPAEISARILVNAAGLGALRFLHQVAGFPDALMAKPYFAKGNYFALSGRRPFKRLVYPVPEAAGLGVHATIDLGGQVRFGPDVEWVEDDADLSVDPARGDRFYAAIRRYWPGLPDGALRADYAGIRPKLGGADQPASDFIIQDWRQHGIDGLVNLLGIESPGLTASLALARHVATILDGQAKA
jgi:L-2-hydroxyglutarate oxidase LhgO